LQEPCSTRGDTRLVTEPDPTSPFRRFPWIQLVFCIACLTMTAWTWMRYSYVWELDVIPQCRRDIEVFPSFWPYRSMRRVKAKIVRYPRFPATNEVDWIKVAVGQGHTTVITPHGATGHIPEDVVIFTGRLVPGHGDGVFEDFMVDTTASRFHPASIAGLVVGAMGCFIFGLYLRAWLRARKVPARGPEPRTAA